MWEGVVPCLRSLYLQKCEMSNTYQDDDESIGDADNLSAGEVRRRLEKYRKKERLEQHKRAMEKVCCQCMDRCGMCPSAQQRT